MLGKKSLEKSAKNVFFHRNTVKRNGWGKKARINFSRNTRIVRAKNVGEKISERSEKNFFFYSHEYRYQKMGGKNARNNFYRNTRIVRAKNVGEKSSERSEKNVF